MAGCILTRLKALFAIVFLLFLGACSSEEQGGKPVVNVWSEFSAAPQSTAFNAIVAEFNRENPDMVVRHTAFENTPYETTLKTALSGGSPPDIVEMDGGANAFVYARAGLLAPIDDVVKPVKGNISPGAEAMYRYRGKAYGMPWQLVIGNMLWYNPDMLKAEGIDPERLRTWAGMLEVAEHFRKKGIAPIAFGNREGWPGNHMFTHLSRRLMTREQYLAIAQRTMDPAIKSDIKWNDPTPVRAWAMYRELVDRKLLTAGYLADDTPTAGGLFLSGKAPLYFMGSWFLGQAEAANTGTPIDMMMFPAIERAPGSQGDLVTNSLVFSLTSKAKQPAAAKRFLTFLTSEKAQQIWAEGVQGLVPYQYDTTSWKLNGGLRKIAALYAAAPSSAPFLDLIEDRSCNVPGIWDGSIAVMTGQLTPKAAGDMHERCVKQLERANGWR
jgi:raffinose/stachyose/melibiose transport system substrate-binding protein